MTTSVVKATLAVAVAGVLLVGSVRSYWRTRTRAAVLLSLGSAFFLIVALAHVCEAFGALRAFGWGQPDTVGHYVDLVAAFAGLCLAGAGLALHYLARRRAH